MPKTMTNLELAQLSRAGRAEYEGGGKVWPPQPPPAPQSDAKAIIAGMERVALAITEANAAQADDLRELAAALRAFAERHTRREPIPYVFKVTKRDDLGRADELIGTPLKKA